MFRDKAIRYDPNMTLDEILDLGNYKNNNIIIDNTKKYYILSKANIKIENYEGLKAKDIVKSDNNGKRIDIMDSHYYKKFQVIEHLRELESKINFDWLEQTEFFLKVKDLCGEEVTTGIINELYNDRKNGNGKGYDEYSGKLIYEGEYLNGKRNGKGKEYDQYKGKLIFEGEYLKGKKWNGIYKVKNIIKIN